MARWRRVLSASIYRVYARCRTPGLRRGRVQTPGALIQRLPLVPTAIPSPLPLSFPLTCRRLLLLQRHRWQVSLLQLQDQPGLFYLPQRHELEDDGVRGHHAGRGVHLHRHFYVLKRCPVRRPVRVNLRRHPRLFVRLPGMHRHASRHCRLLEVQRRGYAVWDVDVLEPGEPHGFLYDVLPLWVVARRPGT